MRKPEIRTELPGPKSRELLELDHAYISPSYTRLYPVFFDRGEGVWLWDVDGNLFLDFTAGIAVNTTGHAHPEIVKAASAQMQRLIHMSGTDFYYAPQARLAAKLAEIVPGGPNRRVFFANSGAEANEAALKLSRYKTRRPIFIAFYGAFHGRTFGALSLTASKAVQRRYFSPLLPQVVHIPYPDPFRPPLGATPDTVSDAVVDYLEHTVFEKLVPPEEVAAIIFEPIQGEGGYVVPPDDFFPKLKSVADRYDILLVDDEVQAGMGRTGKMFAIEHFGIIPDIVTIAKGIASGLPLGAMVARKGLMDWVPGAHASTFGGNPVSCAAALKTIEMLEGGLVENAARMGAYFMEHLRKFMDRYEWIGDVRGKGLMIGMDLVKDRKTREGDSERRDKIIWKAYEKGLLLLGAGKSVVRFVPSLTVTREEMDVALEILEKVLQEVG